ncbi:LOW QUALITY PROTEIN: uncharacterized protein LOC124951144 [Vespa velutina]|uniref:LOW QUALITY PROTEIN: uncharacterized protein LOC124951144 n=1 Tax=Vespa velutina TaxID=202808 RepID=UPI001FB2D7A0|nr:LOW QUALITY PROTEIN: uncharacterized protein LOC124951144 [Vespa velutina]
MLTAKQVKIHKMSDERWTTRDKINQYRGVLKLYARDKKIRALELIKLKQRVLKNLKSLQTDVREYRDIVSQIINGNKIRLLPILQQHDNFHLAFGQLESDELHNRIYQNSELFHRQLDKLRYEKEKLAKKFFDLQVLLPLIFNKIKIHIYIYTYIHVYAHIKLDSFLLKYLNKFFFSYPLIKFEKCFLLEEESAEIGTDHFLERLMAYLQRSVSKQNGVKAIRSTYLKIINILKKDAIYYDALLKALKDDQKNQCKVIVKTTIMGQLATENLDDLKEKYKSMTVDVVKNMKERERTLIIARERVADLWEYAKSLVRIEVRIRSFLFFFPFLFFFFCVLSDVVLAKKYIDINDSVHLENQLKRLEEICEKLKDTVLVRSHNELLPRLEEQMRQKVRLINQFNYNTKERNDLLHKKEEALITLESLEHTMVATTGQYRIDKKAMLEEMEIQKKRIINYKDLRRSHGELSIKIIAALQNMLVMLICVKQTRWLPKMNSKKQAKMPIVDELDTEDTGEAVLEKIISNGVVLLAQITRKMGVLFGISNFELDKEKDERARQLYQNYIADYNTFTLKFGKDELEPALIVEHEIVDPNVLTRADVKNRSRKVVEANLKID